MRIECGDYLCNSFSFLVHKETENEAIAKLSLKLSFNTISGYILVLEDNNRSKFALRIESICVHPEYQSLGIRV